MSTQFDASREGQLDEKGLSWGYWWVTHKVQVRRWFSAILGVTGGLLLAYGLFGFADYYFGSGVSERKLLGTMTKQISNYTAYNEARAPEPLSTEDSYAMADGASKYDLVAMVKNPNMRWLARFDYHFEAGSEKTANQPGYVLPGETAYLEQIGYKSEGGLSGASLQIENLRWIRVDMHEVKPDYTTWATGRLAISAVEPKFVRPAAGDGLGTSRATFKLVNESAFSYYKVGLVVLLWGDGGLLVGVNRIIVSDLRAGDSRDVEAVWFGDVAGVKLVEVKPVIDIFDNKNYIPVGK